MFHGEAFLSEIQQSGPRGSDKLFSTNWWMPMAQRKFGNGTLTIRTMLSFEPATVSDRRYPELFQQGETAFGRPIVDGQHPHDFFMELAALYDYKVGGAHAVVGVRRSHGRSGDGAAGVSSPRFGVGRSHRAAGTSSSGLDPHRRGRDHGRASRIAISGSKPRAFTDASPTNSAGTSTPEKSTPGRRGSPPIPARTGALQYSIAQLHSPESLAPAEDVAG